MGIGDFTLVENLQQNVHHIRMCLFDFVKEDYGIGLAANLFGKLSRFVVAHIAGRGAHNSRYGEFLHELRHIKADKGIRPLEHFVRQNLYKLRFTHAGGSHENEACRTAPGGNLHPGAANRRRHKLAGSVLPDNMAFENAFKLAQLL